MALHSTPLLIPEGPPPLVDGVDVFLLEVHNASQSVTGDNGDTESFRGASVLVSISATEADQRALWTLRHALAFGRCTEFGGVEWPERLAERVATRRPEFATAVVFAGSSADGMAETVQASIYALRRLLGSALALVVVVSAATESLESLDGASGFVRGVRSTDGDTARQVFLALSSLHACEALNGIDVLDVAPALGTATAPALLATALWLREGDGRLVYPSNADKLAVASAARTVAVPFFSHTNWDELRRFRRAFLDGAHASDASIFFETNNALIPGLLPTGLGWAPIFCALTPKADADQVRPLRPRPAR